MSRKLGNIAEDIAYEYICDLGYQIIERNFTLRGGEIDIIVIHLSFMFVTKFEGAVESAYNP